MDSSIAYFWLHVDEWHCATSSNTTATNMENSDCLHSTKQLNTKNTNIVYERLPDSIHPGCKPQQASNKARYGHTHTHTKPFNGPLSRTTRVGQYQKKHSCTHTHPDHQTSFITYYDPQHPPCSVYVFDSPFPQPLSRSSLVFLLVWGPLLRTPYISSPNCYLLFATHAHTIATCFAVVLSLCHLFLISLSAHYLEIYLHSSKTISIFRYA